MLLGVICNIIKLVLADVVSKLCLSDRTQLEASPRNPRTRRELGASTASKGNVNNDGGSQCSCLVFGLRYAPSDLFH